MIMSEVTEDELHFPSVLLSSSMSQQSKIFIKMTQQFQQGTV